MESLDYSAFLDNSSLLALAMFSFWLIAMIMVPLLVRKGVDFRGRAITFGVLAQVILVVVTLFSEWPVVAVVPAIVLVPILGWIAEFIGSRTGIPFGRYHYTDVLQPQIHKVPVAIPLAWLMMLPPSWAVAYAIAPEGSRIGVALIGGAAFMAWDLYLDPQLVRWDFWRWQEPGIYLGIPIKNFFGWFLWAALITYIVGPRPLSAFPLLVVYVMTWLFQFGGHLVFWKWPISGIVGFVAMGGFAIPAILRLIAG